MNSIYTIGVGSANSEGERANYDERCSAKMTTSFVQNRFANRNQPLHVVNMWMCVCVWGGGGVDGWVGGWLEI